MIREIGVLEPGGLLDIYQLINGTIKKSTLHIHLVELEVMMRSISKSYTNGLKASHGGKSFTVVKTFDLGKTLCHQPCLVPYDNTMTILLVLEYPLGPNNIRITFGPLH